MSLICCSTPAMAAGKACRCSTWAPTITCKVAAGSPTGATGAECRRVKSWAGVFPPRYECRRQKAASRASPSRAAAWGVG